VAKTVKFEGTFTVSNDAGTIEAKKVIRDELEVDEATQHFPQKVAGATVDHPIGMGGVTLCKRLLLWTDYEVTVKLSEITDTGFKFGPGYGVFPSSSGITGIWITTGPNETQVEAVVTGD
jgi:hypothetical protein